MNAETRYERDFYGRTRPVVNHSADPLTPERPAAPEPAKQSWFARLVQAVTR